MPDLSESREACIDACNACLTAVHVCLAEHLGEPEMRRCHELCLDCADLCAACVPMLARDSEYHARVCEVGRAWSSWRWGSGRSGSV